ncbi:MAG TPA: hypothetical protein VKE96_15185 [Vicinamibacterales bacterium]|nr:hypothetical protein [Vicinamibacterales bacterium]
MSDEHDDDLRRALQQNRPDLDLLDDLEELTDVDMDPRIDDDAEDAPDADELE